MKISPLREQFSTLVGDHFEVWISEGWLALVTEALTRLLKEQGIAPALRVDQIKQKWGKLCINGEAFTERALAIAEEVADSSSRICEICGAQGEPIKNSRGWVIAVRCVKHFDAREILVPDESHERARDLQFDSAVPK